MKKLNIWQILFLILIGIWVIGFLILWGAALIKA